MSDKTELREQAFALYKPPFKFRDGYIYDSAGHMVSDGPDETGIQRVRGWGRIGYMPKGEQLQDAVGELIAEALTAAWNRRATIRSTAELTTPATFSARRFRPQIANLVHEFEDLKPGRRGELALSIAELLDEILAASSVAVAPADAPLTDAQIAAGAAILCDCPKPRRIGRNAAIDVAHAMGVGAPADAVRDAEDLRRYREINTPEIADFVKGVEREALHQRERWSNSHDAGKAPEDWFWLLGYLGGKALHAAKTGNTDKALHHTISSAAALLNWHAAILGTHSAMRPGIEPPTDTTKEPAK